MKIFKTLSLRNRLTSFFFGIALITILVFANLLIDYLESGMEDSAKLHLMTESKSFSRAYKKNPNIELPSTFGTSFSLDQLPAIHLRGNNILEGIEMPHGTFQIIFAEDELPDGLEEDPIIIIYRSKLFDGRTLYSMVKYDYNKLIEENADKLFDQRLKVIAYIACVYLILIILALWFYNYKVNKRTSQLVDWAEEISTTYTPQIPNFKFDEYNRIATCLHNSLQKNASLVEREKKFLSHASHELRTPIAIIRANMEILEKIALPDRVIIPIERIDRASIHMQQLTETLLWIARKSDNKPVESLISLPSLLKQIINEQKYLLQDESVEIITKFSGISHRMLAAVPIMIVLGNLIRNAFQYTHYGWVKISHIDDSIYIENNETQETTDEYEISFGFGIELTQKVCKKLGWKLSIQQRETGVKAQLQLPPLTQ